ncbi:hypothetical protein [Acanthopleuribacter pedis]|nr:hypothetical protein [Acanthopleuribacter pedis]
MNIQLSFFKPLKMFLLEQPLGLVPSARRAIWLALKIERVTRD